MRRPINIWDTPSYSEIARGYAKMWKDIAKQYEPKKVKARRKNFRKQTQKAILLFQNYQCTRCFIYLKHPDFHHKDGDPSNNIISNCEALCPNCHAEITRPPIQFSIFEPIWRF